MNLMAVDAVFLDNSVGMKKKSLKLNYIFNLCYQLLNLVLPLVTTPYIARVLGADGVGKYSYSYTIASIFVAIAQLGTVSFAVREIAYHYDDQIERSRLFWEIFLFRCISISISFILFYFFFCCGRDSKVFLAQSLCIIAVCFDISWYFQGMEQFALIVVRDFFSRILGAVCVFIFVKSHNDLVLYIIILATTTILGRAANWLVLSRYLAKVPFAELKVFRHLKTYIILFIPQIANQLYLVVDKSMIGMITGNDFESGYYAQADKILKVCTAILTAIVTVLSPRIADAFSREDFEGVENYIKKTSHFLWMIAIPMSIGLISTIDMIIPWFLGPGYDSVPLLVYIFSPHIITLSFTTFLGMLLVNTKKQNEYAISVAIGVTCNIIMNAFLIQRYYSVGAAISSVIAELIIASIQVVFLSKQIDIKLFLPNVFKYCLAAAFMAVTVCFTKGCLTFTFAGTIIIIIIGTIVYFSCLFIFKDSFLCSYVRLYLDRLKKTKVNT